MKLARAKKMMKEVEDSDSLSATGPATVCMRPMTAASKCKTKVCEGVKVVDDFANVFLAIRSSRQDARLDPRICLTLYL